MRNVSWLASMVLAAVLLVGGASSCGFNPETLAASGASAEALATAQRAMNEAAARFLANAQRVQQERDIGQLSDVQAEQQLRQLQIERDAALQVAIEQIGTAGADLAANLRALANDSSGVSGEQLGAMGGVAGLVGIGLNLWRNYTRKRELEQLAVKGGAV